MSSALEETENGRTRRVSEAAAFRARVEERLRSLEAEVADVKSRQPSSVVSSSAAG